MQEGNSAVEKNFLGDEGFHGAHVLAEALLIIMTIIQNRATLLGDLLLQGVLGLGCLSHFGVKLAAQETSLSDLPKTVLAKNFSELMNNSPFTRSLDLSDSLILTGVAKVEGKPVATLMNRESKETYVVSENPNAQGWKMVGISDGSDLGQVTAKIALSGGEVVTVRFDEAQLKPGEARPAAGLGGDQRGGEKHGRRKRAGGGPPPEIMEKLRSLTDEQRSKLREYMTKKMQGKPDMTREERGELLGNAVKRLTAGGKKN